MEIKTWSKEEVLIHFSHCPTLKEVIIALENAAESIGKVVCSISMNGLKLTEIDESKLGTTLTGDIESLRIEMEDPKTLAAEALVSLVTNITQIRDRAVIIAEEFRKGDFSKAQRGFCACMEQTQFIMDALRALKPRLRSEGELDVIWSRAEKQSQSMIAELMQSYKDKDYVLVADVLEYEVYNSMEAWRLALEACNFD